MDLLLMRSLLAVAEHGGVTAAAASMGVSQSALSRRIDQLEAELEVGLLERVGRGVVLTEMGRVVVGEARLLVQRYEQLKLGLQERARLQAGVVRIGGGATASAYLLPSAIARFRTEFPRVVFQLKEAGSRDVEQAVIDEQLELGIVTLPTRTSELAVKPLTADRIVLVASREHPLAEQRRVTVRDLEGQSLVGFEAGTAVRRLIDGALREANVTVDVNIELRSVAAILHMVETTRSMAFVSEQSAPPAVSRRRRAVVPIAVRGLKVVRELALIHKRHRPLSTAAEAFTRILLEQLGAVR